MKAYEVMEKFGFCQGAFARDKDGEGINDLVQSDGAVNTEIVSVCVLGALRIANVVYEISGPHWMEYVRQRETLTKALGIPAQRWNDKPDQYKEAVIGVLKELDL